MMAGYLFQHINARHRLLRLTTVAVIKTADGILSDDESVADPNGKRRRLPSVAKDDAINDTVSEPAIEPTREQGRSQYITRTTTTNNNQMSERQRPRRHEVAEAKAPPSRDEIAEQIAHGSINVDDAPVISWILDQPMKDGGYFLSTVRHPYATAAAMLRCARQFGNPGAKKVAA
ncbi:hypothetical protein Ptr902_07782 [Pyrenophora tritici-repentis]|nr:hypothetical protein Ptr902_07782 [Pyrenophora tritici-repentis]